LPGYNSGTFNPQDPQYSLRGLGWDKVFWSNFGPDQVEKDGEVSGYASDILLFPNINGYSGTSEPYSKGDGVFVSFNATPANLNAALPVTQSSVATAVFEATQTGAVAGTVSAMPAGQFSTTRLAGVQLYIDTHGTGIYEPGDPSTQTSASGTFLFNDVPPGTYELHVRPLAGYRAKQPKTWTATVDVVAGDVTIQNWVLTSGKTAGGAARAIVSGNPLVINLGPGMGPAASVASRDSADLSGNDGTSGTSAVLHPRVRQATHNPINRTARLTLARQIKARATVRVRLETSGHVRSSDVT